MDTVTTHDVAITMTITHRAESSTGSLFEEEPQAREKPLETIVEAMHMTVDEEFMPSMLHTASGGCPISVHGRITRIGTDELLYEYGFKITLGENTEPGQKIGELIAEWTVNGHEDFAKVTRLVPMPLGGDSCPHLFASYQMNAN